MRRLLVLWLFAGCAHSPLSTGALEATRGVAFVTRIAPKAGPRSSVFRDDAAYGARLREKQLAAPEADRRLMSVLERGSFQKEADGTKRLMSPTTNRFEIADTLRAEVVSRLPARAPWTKLVEPTDVTRALESLLVQDTGAAPEYERLMPLGADSVVEIIVEEYGLRSEGGRAGAYLIGSARMFRIGGGELYHRRFSADDLAAQQEPLDPFAVAKEAVLFGTRIKALTAGVAELVARDLSPGP